MDKKRNLNGAALASSVAVLLLAGAGCGDSGGDDTSGTSDPLVCLGGNDCSGMSECAGGPGGSDCAGMNDCAGMGWAYTKTEKECTDKGGTVKTEDDAG